MIRVHHDIGDLANDLATIPQKFHREAPRIVRRNAEQGNRLARANAKRTAGRHGKRYPNAFSVEMVGPMEAEYGPDASKPQGGMSFEFGSRNQPPHLDLAKSLDAQGPKFRQDVADMIDGLFW